MSHAFHEDGATGVEYTIVAAFMAGILVAVVLLVGAQTRENFCRTGTAFGEAPVVEHKNHEPSCANQNAERSTRAGPSASARTD